MSETRVKVTSHWHTAKPQIEARGKDLLLMVAFYIEQQFKLRVTDLSLIDTGFYRNSAYVSGQGVTTYGQGSGQGARRKQVKDSKGRRVWRERAERAHPERGKHGIIIGVAASYAYWLEQRAHPLTFALQKAKSHFGGSGVTVEVKVPNGA